MPLDDYTAQDTDPSEPNATPQSTEAVEAPEAEASDDHPSLIGHNRLAVIDGLLDEVGGQCLRHISGIVESGLRFGRLVKEGFEIADAIKYGYHRKWYASKKRPFHYNTATNWVRVVTAFDDKILSHNNCAT